MYTNRYCDTIIKCREASVVRKYITTGLEGAEKMVEKRGEIMHQTRRNCSAISGLDFQAFPHFFPMPFVCVCVCMCVAAVCTKSGIKELFNTNE